MEGQWRRSFNAVGVLGGSTDHNLAFSSLMKLICISASVTRHRYHFGSDRHRCGESRQGTSQASAVLMFTPSPRGPVTSFSRGSIINTGQSTYSFPDYFVWRRRPKGPPTSTAPRPNGRALPLKGNARPAIFARSSKCFNGVEGRQESRIDLS
jgi:hypothetical protein